MTALSLTHRIYPFLLFNIGAFLSAVPLSLAQNSIIEQVQKEEGSIVTIQAQQFKEHDDTLTPAAAQNGAAVLEKSGAGIVIDPMGYIVTNTHTILDAQFIFVTLRDGTRLAATIASIAPNSDLTILKINPPLPLKALPWADSETAQLDDEIIAIGNSALWKQTISGGKIKGIGRGQSGAGPTIELLEMDLNLDYGDSGGPILDRRGHFLGIVVAKNMKVTRSSFAIPANKIREHFLKYLNESQR